MDSVSSSLTTLVHHTKNAYDVQYDNVDAYKLSQYNEVSLCLQSGQPAKRLQGVQYLRDMQHSDLTSYLCVLDTRGIFSDADVVANVVPESSMSQDPSMVSFASDKSTGILRLSSYRTRLDDYEPRKSNGPSVLAPPPSFLATVVPLDAAPEVKPPILKPAPPTKTHPGSKTGQYVNQQQYQGAILHDQLDALDDYQPCVRRVIGECMYQLVQTPAALKLICEKDDLYRYFVHSSEHKDICVRIWYALCLYTVSVSPQASKLASRRVLEVLQKALLIESDVTISGIVFAALSNIYIAVIDDAAYVAGMSVKKDVDIIEEGTFALLLQCIQTFLRIYPVNGVILGNGKMYPQLNQLIDTIYKCIRVPFTFTGELTHTKYTKSVLDAKMLFCEQNNLSETMEPTSLAMGYCGFLKLCTVLARHNKKYRVILLQEGLYELCLQVLQVQEEVGTSEPQCRDHALKLLQYLALDPIVRKRFLADAMLVSTLFYTIHHENTVTVSGLTDVLQLINILAEIPDSKQVHDGIFQSKENLEKLTQLSAHPIKSVARVAKLAIHQILYEP